MMKAKTLKSSVIPIKPGKLLSLNDSFDERINFFMPPSDGIGILSVLESILLIKMLRIVDANFAFEFGTFKGYTTRLLLENLPDRNLQGHRIFTLDLESIEGIEFSGDDERIARISLSSHRAYLLSKKASSVCQLLMDSISLNEAEYMGKIDLIFIDANHDLKYVKSDTEKSLVMRSEKSFVVWHDFGNPLFPELTSYLENLACTMPVYSIQNTMLAFSTKGISI